MTLFRFTQSDHGFLIRAAGKTIMKIGTSTCKTNKFDEFWKNVPLQLKQWSKMTRIWNNKTGKYISEVCGTHFNYSSSYCHHYQNSHLELSQFECKHCSRTFSKLDNIYRYVKNIHSDVLGPFIRWTFPKLAEDSLSNKYHKLCQKTYYNWLRQPTHTSINRPCIEVKSLCNGFFKQ